MDKYRKRNRGHKEYASNDKIFFKNWNLLLFKNKFKK